MRVTAAFRSRKFPGHSASGDVAEPPRSRSSASLNLNVTFTPCFRVNCSNSYRRFGSISSRRSRNAGNANVQRLIRASKSSRNFPVAIARARSPIRPGDQLEIALRFLVRSDGQKSLVFQRAEQHRLLIRAKLADLIEE